ncbi:MAG TPA: endonuclease domain-containing protein, partial [Burkholderiaceae bacterium]|nr:endonuclease domain-containing protein [Burkholderiaceae bacterium]
MPAPKSLLHFARALRAESTDAEQRLWYHLRARRMMGMKFLRQRPIGPYIVDFVCLESRLIIELDGGQHQEQARLDRRRDELLRARGFRVLRFWNDDVLQRTRAVLEEIWTAASSPSPPPLSRCAGEGRERVPIRMPAHWP